MKNQQPKWADRFLNWICSDNPLQILQGDIYELYQVNIKRYGLVRAKYLFILDVLLTVPFALKRRSKLKINHTVMLKNQIKIAIRVFLKHRTQSLINISGLSLGLACSILIMLWVQDEMSFDKFNRNYESIYRVVADWPKNDWRGYEGTPDQLGEVAKEGVPEINNVARIAPLNRKVISFKDNRFYEDGGILADPSLFEIFTFPFKKGSIGSSFNSPTDVVITESMAKKYFADEEAMDKSLQIDDRLFNVSGVLYDLPDNSHLQFDFVSSFEFLSELSTHGRGWGAFNYMTYAQIVGNNNPDTAASKLTKIALDNECYHVKKGAFFKMQPLDQVHLDGRTYSINFVSLGNKKHVLILSTISILILLLACFNFMNLSTAKSTERAKEIGIRKSMGAIKWQMMRQFYIESLVMTFFSLVVAIAIVALTIPLFNAFSGKMLSLDYLNPIFWTQLVGLATMVGLVSGTYPALFLSSFSSIKVLKGEPITRNNGRLFRKTLVVLQFSITILLLIATVTIFQQFNYIQNTNLGINTSNVILVPIKENLGKKFDVAKQSLLSSPAILSVSAHHNLFTEMTWRFAPEFDVNGEKKSVDLILSGIENDFFETLEIPIVTGRVFSGDIPNDGENHIVLNESAVKDLGLDNPLGHVLKLPSSSPTIIGVVEDVHFRSLQQEMEARIFYVTDMEEETSEGMMLVKTDGNSPAEALSHISDVWEETNTISPFEYMFLDGEYDKLYRSERKYSSIINVFTLMALLISCIGLYGLATFMIENRRKEIGIRKVHGASSFNVIYLLSKSFTKWVLLANILAWPAAYYFMNNWLKDFAYRVEISWWVFAIAGLGALLLALFTVSTQSLKATRANPIDALRYE